MYVNIIFVLFVFVSDRQRIRSSVWGIKILIDIITQRLYKSFIHSFLNNSNEHSFQTTRTCAKWTQVWLKSRSMQVIWNGAILWSWTSEIFALRREIEAKSAEGKCTHIPRVYTLQIHISWDQPVSIWVNWASFTGISTPRRGDTHLLLQVDIAKQRVRSTGITEHKGRGMFSWACSHSIIAFGSHEQRRNGPNGKPLCHKWALDDTPPAYASRKTALPKTHTLCKAHDNGVDFVTFLM